MVGVALLSALVSVYRGDARQDSPCAKLPGSLSLTSVSTLPDPFKFLNGTAVTSKDGWECRQAETQALFEKLELGTKPGKPTTVTGTFSGSSLTVQCSEGGKSISFSVSISAPSGGSGPYPGIIAYGSLSLPRPNNVATLTFNNDDLGAQQDTGSRGKGKFYDLYGSSHDAGALTAWAWGVSRILDALESASGANIDVKRVGVTGCSRNGKGALVAGALDERIALTLPQESGSGGSACWRLSDYQQTQGDNVQTAGEIVGENCWFSKNFDQYSKSVNQLPFDHHQLAGLVAPRGLLVIENIDYEWLGPWSSNGCMKGAQKIYAAVGAESAFGFSQVGGHQHCSFPSNQQADLDGYVQKFLLGTGGSTGIFCSTGNYQFDESQWLKWTVPTLG